MNREQAVTILREELQNNNLIKHSLAVEAIMRHLAKHFNEDAEKWGITGLLHDIDYEKVQNDLAQHSLMGAKMLAELGFDEDTCEAVKAHNESHGIVPRTMMGKALFACDPLTGLIVAATLVLPSKKIANLSTESVLNRFNEKSFARGAKREIVKKCEEFLRLGLPEFIEIGLSAMREIADELGL